MFAFVVSVLVFQY